MVQKKKAVRRPFAACATAESEQMPATESGGREVQHPARKSPQPRVWRRVAKLAGDALVALEAGNVREVRSYLEAIRAVGLCAEETVEG